MNSTHIFSELKLSIFDNYFHPDPNVKLISMLMPNIKGWYQKNKTEYAVEFQCDEKLSVLKNYLTKILNQLQSPIMIDVQSKTLILKNVNENNLLPLMEQKNLFVRIKNPDSMTSQSLKPQ
jgi:hypothetical protein